MRLVFIDFEDSFTNNILSYFDQFDFHIDIVNFRNLSKSNISDLLENQLVVLGPGPGHPEEYLKSFVSVGVNFKDELSKAKRIIGICLGHQLVLNIFDELRVVRSSRPMHGQAITMKLEEDEDLFDCFNREDRTELIHAKLQRYNSLKVEIDSGEYKSGNKECLTQFIFDNNDELLMAYRPNFFFTMQFHPESVGTSCNNILFEAMNKFLM
ncbi:MULTISPECIES: aminodeoxychorismate/anthranilate synthase component II [unclassified Halobacteriovorax]|uniref:aminodeoxychorismate/anthranilate synthase component II n=1 Tax=unclassified Halobacteriovorax TaxID=2639665 RepID=UPI000CD24B24|nr:aminodeoxychorismate/anthranilate synthase component II [Halobacteriovorax sp. DA5]POB14168.1 hypothetical protein C0Z22_03510 [Halobacteriovorax sp. DA5]